MTLADRVTAVADLTAIPLTLATRADLVSDLIAGTGSGRDLRAHQFRFARFVRTTSLQARSGSLVASATRKPAPSTTDAAELAALLDIAADTVRGDIDPIEVLTDAHAVPRAAPPGMGRADHACLMVGKKYGLAIRRQNGKRNAGRGDYSGFFSSRVDLM